MGSERSRFRQLVVVLVKPKSVSMDASLYQALLHTHSVGRWIVLLLLIFAILNSLIAGSRPFIRSDNRLGLLLTIFADLMLLVGIALWYFGPRGYQVISNAGGMGNVMRDNVSRFYAVEHFAGMLIAIVLMHLGKAQARKRIGDRAKHRRTMIFYLLALLIILVSIPWPFRGVSTGSGWY
jgi:L-asparagine transporter-like permease